MVQAASRIKDPPWRSSDDRRPRVFLAGRGQRPHGDGALRELEMPELQGGSHLIGGVEAPGRTARHRPRQDGIRPVRLTSRSRRPATLSEPEQVSVLESGGLVTYEGLEEADRAALEQRVADRFDGRVAVTSYDKLDEGEVAFTAWGAVKRCDDVDLEALDAFLAATRMTGQRIPMNDVPASTPWLLFPLSRLFVELRAAGHPAVVRTDIIAKSRWYAGQREQNRRATTPTCGP